MTQRPLEDLTLREKLVEAERRTREVIEHLDRGFGPIALELRRFVRRTGNDQPVEDVTIRSAANRVLESDRFTDALFETINAYCANIETAMGESATPAAE